MRLPAGESRLLGAPADGIFEIGSITKALTGVLLAEAMLRGEVRLDDPLGRFVTAEEAPLHWPDGEPTLLELATHRAGLPNVPRGLARPELAFLLGLRRSDPWGGVDAAAYRSALAATRVKARGRFRYSSIGYGLLGDVVARAAGTTYEALLRKRLCEPLGLGDTWIDPPAAVRGRLLVGHTRRGRPAPPLRDAMPAAGSVRSSAGDLLRLLGAALEERPAFVLAAEPHLRLGRRVSFGLGWVVAERKGRPPLVWHNGGTWGFRSFAGYVPEDGTAVAVLSNTFRGVDRLGWDLLEAAAGRGPHQTV